MRLFIDCEFNGFDGELISMALVSDDGREWYAVLPEPRVWDNWCFHNVLPVISAEKPTIYANSMEEFRVSLFAFLGGFERPTFVADWPADIYHLSKVMLGSRYEQTRHIACQMELLPNLPDYAPAVPHNALSDARAIRDAISQ